MPGSPPGPAGASGLPPGAGPVPEGTSIHDGRAWELRIHGVGGSPGPRLLGYESSCDVEVVGEGVEGSAFLARRSDPTVEGYDWGNLTSGSGTQPFWVLLLPFTLVNVAGWMHPRRGRWAGVTRLTVHVLSVLLTATFVFSLAILLVDLIGYQWTRRLACAKRVGVCAGPALVPQQWGGVAVGLALLALCAWGLVYVAGRSQTAFEGKEPPEELRRRAGMDHDVPWRPDEGLESPGFFWHPGAAGRLLRLHEAVLGVSWLAVVVLTVLRLRGAPPPRLGLDVLLAAVNIPAAVAIGLLWLPWFLTLLAAPFRKRMPSTSLAGPAIAATLGFGLVTAVFSGTALVAAKRLGHWPERPGLHDLKLGVVASLVDFWGGALVVAAVAAVLLVAWLQARAPHGSTDGVPDRTAGAGCPLDGADPGWRRAIQSKRSLAWVAHQAAWGVLALAFGLWVTDVVAFLIRSSWFTHPVLKGPEDTGQIFYRIGAYGLALLPLFVFQLVRKGWGGRTFVSTIWDVLTFLPRRFSPLAVRCYAERAVPELQGRIHYQVGDHGRPVLVSAHSQGTIIAFAALASLPDDLAARVALVTYGSPIAAIYGTFFPAYFGDEAVGKVRAKLPVPGSGLLGWRNYYRATDPIGGPIFATLPPTDPPGDVELPDPLPDPPTGAGKSPGTEEAPLELDRPTWTQIAVHSYYLAEPALKDWVGKVKKALAGELVGPKLDLTASFGEKKSL